MFNDQNSTTHTIHILSSKLLKLSNIERAIDMIINVSKNIHNLIEEQQISLLWLGVMMEEVQHSSNSNISIFRQFSIFNFDSFFLLPKMNSYLNDSRASSSQTTTIPFEIACNIVAGGAEDYSQSKLLTFLKKWIVSSNSKLVVLLLDGFLVRMLSEQAPDIKYEELASVNISAWKLIFDTLLNSIGEEVKPQLIDAFANTALMAKKLIPPLIAIAFSFAKSLGALDRHLFETLSICVVELFLKLQNANDFKALLDQCLEFVNGKEITIKEQKGGEAYLSELVLIGIIDIGEHDKDIVVKEADVFEKINVLQTMLAIADRLPKDVLDKVLQKIHNLLSWTCRGSVDDGPRMVETKLYDLLTHHLVQLNTSREVILNSVAFKGIHGVLYEKLKRELGQQSGEELADLAVGVIATPASAWLEVFGGKCAIKPHLEQLIGLISSIQVVEIIFHGERELKPLSAIVEQILSSSTIEIGLLEMNSSIGSKVPHCYFQETLVDMEKWYNNGRNNLQFIIHRLLIKYSIASNLVKVTILAIYLLSNRSKIDLSLHKIEENETILCNHLQPIKRLIEELQVISYFLLIMIESCFQLRKEAIRHKEQTKTVNDLEDFDDGAETEKAIAGCEDIIAALQEMDINSFQHLQDIIRLETKTIHILKNRANEGSGSEFSATPSHQSWAISVEAALCWFISLSNDILQFESPLKEDCKLYLWWECKLTSVCHAVYILHRAVDSHEGMHEVGGKINNEEMSVDKALVIIDNVFNFYNEVLSVEAQQQRMESLLSNAIAAQEWIAEKKSTESRQINKSKKKLPISASDIQVKRYFDNYNGIHRFADIFSYMSNFSLFVAKEDSPSSSSSDDDSEVGVFNAFRRTATSLKNKGNRGPASKFMTMDQLFSSMQLYAPKSSSYCTSIFTSLKLYLGSIYQQLNPLESSLTAVENASAVINLDHRWLDDAIRPLTNESMDVNIMVNNSKFQYFEAQSFHLMIILFRLFIWYQDR